MQSDTPPQIRRAAFLDRDGVLNVDVGYTYRIEDWVWMPGAQSALERLKQAGYLNIVVTNQSGIARGYYTVADLHALHNYVRTQTPGLIDAIFYCPHGPDAGCRCRKPMPGMLIQAASEWGIQFEQSILIGDKESDMQAANAVGVQGYRFPGGDLDAFVSSILDR